MPHPYDAITWDELRRRTSIKWTLHPPDVLPTFVAEMDFPLAAPIRDRLHALVDEGDTGYMIDSADQIVGEAVAGFAADRWDWAADPERAVVLPDVLRALEIGFEAFSEPGDGVVVNTPIYPPFLKVIAAAGRVVVESPLALGPDGFRLDLADLERRFAAGAKVFVLCNPHNPTGAVPSEAELRGVVDLAARYDVVVVSDEVHGPLTYPEAAFVPLHRLPGADAVSMAVTSASKGWNIPGLKAAVMFCGTEERRQLVLDMPERARMGASILGVHANVAAFTHARDWLDDTVGYLDGNRKALADLLAAEVPQARFTPPAATYLAWVDLRAYDLDDPAATLLERGRLAVADGRTYGPPGYGWVRLNVATPRPLLEEQVRRMRTALA